MAFWLNLTFKYYLSSLKIMEYSKDLKNFKDLDYLLGKDYIDGNYDLSKAILEKSASLLIEHSVTIQNRPFRDVYLVYNEKLEKLSQRIDSIQNTMVGKTEEYNKTISDVNVELQAFEKVIDRLIPSISDSIKELRDLIDDLKNKDSKTST